MKMEPVDFAFEGMKHRLPQEVTLDVFRYIFKDWKIEPLRNNMGAVLMKGPEIHISVIPNFKGKWFSRKLFNSTLGKILKEYSYSITSAPKDNLVAISFITKLGFEFDKEINNIIWFKMRTCKYVRS